MVTIKDVIKANAIALNEQEKRIKAEKIIQQLKRRLLKYEKGN